MECFSHVLFPMNIAVSKTSHSLANTGIQQVTRQLFHSIDTVNGVVFDPYEGAWRNLDSKEKSFMSIHELPANKSSRRSSSWSWGQKFSGSVSRCVRGQCEFDGPLLLPEVFVLNRSAITRMRAQFSGPSVALFHDALPWRFPEWSTPECRLNHINYMRTLSKLEGVVAVSSASLEDLKSFWHSDGIAPNSWPNLGVVPLASGYERPEIEQTQVGLSKPFEMLMVATLEARKNHMSLLDACESLWEDGHTFKLRLIGGLSRRTGQAVVSKIKQLKARGLAVDWEGAVAQHRVYEAYLEADLVLVPSLYEGFGLPVVEALSLGKPVICTGYGALKEVAAGGGCLCLTDGEAKSIASGLSLLLADRLVYQRLKTEAAKRVSRRWADVVADLEEIIRKL